MSKPLDITKESRVPLYVLWGAILATATVVSFTARLWYSVDARLERIEQHMNTDWTRYDHDTWALRLANENPNLFVPGLNGHHRTPASAAQKPNTATATNP